MDKKIIISLVSLAASAGLVFFLIIPLWTSVGFLRQEVQGKKEQLATIEELLTKTRQLEKDYQEVSEEAAKISFALPKEEDIPHLLVQFESLAANSGLLLEALSFGQLTRETDGLSSTGRASLNSANRSKNQRVLPFPSLTVNVALSGSYDAFKRYLTGLEKSVRSLDARAIEINLPESDSSDTTSISGIFKFTLGLDVYYQ